MKKLPETVLEDHIHEALSLKVVLFEGGGRKNYMLVLLDHVRNSAEALCIGDASCAMRAFERVLKRMKPEKVRKIDCRGLDCKGCLC